MDGEVENSIRAKLTFELGNSQTPEVHATPPGVHATVIEAANRVAVTSDWDNRRKGIGANNKRDRL
jgi:hypothetical protein